MCINGKAEKSIIFFAVMITLFIGCGNENKEKNMGLPDENITVNNLISESYTIVPVFSHDSVCSEDIFKNELFSLYKERDHVYVSLIDLENPNISNIISVDIPTEQQIQEIAIDNNGLINILAIQPEGETIDDWNHVDVFWHQANREGVILNSIDITEALTGFFYFPCDFAIDADGNAYVLFFEGLFALDSSGDFAFKIELEGGIGFFYKNEKGSVGITYTENSYRMRLSAIIDFNAQSLDAIQELTAYMGNAINGVGAGEAQTLFIANGTGAYDFDPVSLGITERLKWSSIQAGVGENTRIYLLANSQILLAVWPNGVGLAGATVPVKYRLIRPMNAEEAIAAKEIEDNGINTITLGTAYPEIGSVLSQAVEDFNANNRGSRIEVITYNTDYYGTSEYETGLMRLNADIVSGKCPDILLLSEGVSWNLYSKLGVFADLNPYLDSDPNFDWADYQENIIRAYEIDDMLFGLPLNYGISTLAARKSDIGDKKEWNLDAFIDFCTGFGTDKLIFTEPTKTAVLNICLAANGEYLVDWSSQNPSLDLSFLIRMLAFSNRYSNEYTDNEFWDVRAQNGDLRLMPGGVNPSMIQYSQAIFGEPVSFIGYPSENGSGNIISSYNIIALSANCRDKETAWSFILCLLSDEVQKTYDFTSVKKSVVDNAIDRAREVNSSGSSNEVSQVIETRGANDDEIALFYEMINSANKIRLHDTQIDDIIKEEAGAYFSGQKSVDEVAGIIENRVMLYVKEVS